MFIKITTLATAAVCAASIANANCTVYVPFASGSATVSASSAALLQRAAATHPGNAIALTGHTDAVGSAALNTRLSNARVQAVASALSGGGASAGQITQASGVADAAPRVAGTGAQALNRRVEVQISDCVPSRFTNGAVATVAGQAAAGSLGGSAVTSGFAVGLIGLAVAGLAASSGT
ncbi:MAG: OmpA family protein [Planktomarina sp.]